MRLVNFNFELFRIIGFVVCTGTYSYVQVRRYEHTIGTYPMFVNVLIIAKINVNISIFYSIFVLLLT